MWVPAQKDEFVDETLWVGANNSKICWIEVGDTEYTDFETGEPHRNYYWAQNSKANGYQEYILDQPAYPPVGQFQRYAITQEPNMPYNIVIGISVVGESWQPGDTIYAHVGLETTTASSLIRRPVQFRDFEIFNGRAYVPWPNRTQYVNAPAWWTWTWPTASNGIPVNIVPR
jgi:hypothetical protein